MENWKSQYDDYDEDRRLEIKKGLESGVDVSLYDSPEFLPIQMQQIRLGLEEGIDVSFFADPKYDWYQMEEISRGMYDKLDVSKYADSSISHEKMRQIRLGLAEKIDLSTVKDLEASVMEQIRFAIKAGIDIIPYVKKGYSANQLNEIRQALEKKISIDDHIDINMRGVAMEQIRLGLEKRLDVSIYAQEEYSWQQMKQIRMGLEGSLDVSLYINPLYSWQQMKQIRMGLEEGLDVSTYKGFSYTARQMESIRIKMLEKKELELARSYETLSGDEVNLQISEDKMIARISIMPGKIESIRAGEIIKFLQENGITYGILNEAIEEALKFKTSDTYVVVAKGKRAVSGTDADYTFYFDTNETKKPKILEDGTPDYSSTKWFEIVQKNNVIAKYNPPSQGEDGINIFGDIIKAKKGKQKKILFGKNIIQSEDNNTFSAGAEGEIKFIKKKDKIIINSVHVVHSNERLIENIYTKGSVLIESDPGSGVEIRSDSDVAIYGILGPAKIISGGNVFIRGGVKGKDRCVIEAKKDVVGKFFESCKIRCGGSVIAGHILNCDVEAENKVSLLGTKSAIVGGVTKAEKCIDTYNVGNINFSDTILEVGKSGFSRRDLIDTNKRIEFIEVELSSIENSIKKMQKYQPLEELSRDKTYIKLKEAVAKKNEELLKLRDKVRELEIAIVNNIEAHIIIRGTAYEGVKVLMADREWEAIGNTGIELSLSKNNYIKVNELSY